MKRVGLFIATNLAIVLVLGVVLNVVLPLFGINASGNAGLLVMAIVFGFGGSFISLLLSKWMAKRSTGAQVITNPATQQERWLLETVSRLASQAGIKMPEVAIFPANEVNAFATGAKRNDALVAVSSGLLNNMTQDEQEAVLAHEIAHIANGDMITMSLLQGVLNTFVIFIARLIAGAVNNAMKNDDGEGGLGFFAYFGVVMVLELVLGMLASIIVMWFSRKREYSADADAGKLVGNHKMIAALERLKQGQPAELEGQFAAFGINSKAKLFASHPSLDSRIAALR